VTAARLWAAALGAAALGAGAEPAAAELHVLVVAGLGGEPGYEQQFAREAGAIAQALRPAAGAEQRLTLLSGAQATSQAITARLKALARVIGPRDELAVMLVGHGSYDGEQYKFNLPGPDLSAPALAALLDAVPAQRQLVVNASSASGAALAPLRAKGRVLISATRSGMEQSATRFAGFWAEALSSSSADLDKDGWITAREAFDFTARRVADYYKQEVSLASEHPQLDGESTAPFRVARLAREGPVSSGLDAALAPLLERRAELERGIETLREQKQSRPREAYLRALEDQLVELAELEDEIERRSPPELQPEGPP
jgi:hypothetical protein